MPGKEAEFPDELIQQGVGRHRVAQVGAHDHHADHQQVVVIHDTLPLPDDLIHQGGNAMIALVIFVASLSPSVTSPPPELEASRVRLPRPSPKNCSYSGWIQHSTKTTAVMAAVRDVSERAMVTRSTGR